MLKRDESSVLGDNYIIINCRHQSSFWIYFSIAGEGIADVEGILFVQGF